MYRTGMSNKNDTQDTVGNENSNNTKRIRPWPIDPRYWSYDDEPVLLIEVVAEKTISFKFQTS